MAGGAAPIFRQIARLLADAIERGELPVGAPLPTEATLGERHGVSRHTVRQALAELRARGLIESRQGVGSLVVRRHARPVYAEAYSSIEELTHFARGTPIRTTAVDDIVADAELAEALRGRPGQGYLRVTGLRHDGGGPDGDPVGHVIVHVDAAYAGIRDQAWRLERSIAETLERTYGLAIARIEQEVAACLLPAGVAAALAVPAGSPALSIRRWYASEGGRVFEASHSRYPMGRFVYRNVLLRQGDR